MKKSLVPILLVVLMVAASLVACTPKPQPQPPQPDKSNVKFQTSSTTMYVGDTYQTVVEGLSDGETIASYDSNNTSVATVDGNGLVTAVAVGSATIKVVSSANGQALLRVEVLSADMIYVPYIFLGATEASLQRGDRYAVGYSVTNKGATVEADVQWTSSDSNVATVSQGVVTAVGTGSCVITATCNYEGEQSSSSLTLTVADTGLSVVTSVDNREIFLKDSVELQLSLTYGGQSVTADSVSFVSSNTSVAKINGSTLQAVAGGNAQITVNFSYNGIDYSLSRSIYVYGYHVVTVKANGKTDSTVRGVMYGDKITLALKTDTREIKCWYVDGEKIDGNTFVMPDKNVTCEAKLINQTEGNFTANFASGTLYTNQISYEFVKGKFADSKGNDVTDGNYVLLDSVVAQNSSLTFNFDESVQVNSSASIVFRIRLDNSAKFYVGTANVAKCLIASNVTGENISWTQTVQTGVWTEVRIPLSTFSADGNFVSSVSVGVRGKVYVDYITLNY